MEMVIRERVGGQVGRGLRNEMTCLGKSGESLQLVL